MKRRSISLERRSVTRGGRGESRRRKVRLAPNCRLSGDSARRSPVLYCASGAVQLNELAAAVLALCDGRLTREQIVSRMLSDSRRRLARNVREFLTAAYRHGWLVNGSSPTLQRAGGGRPQAR